MDSNMEPWTQSQVKAGKKMGATRAAAKSC